MSLSLHFVHLRSGYIFSSRCLRRLRLRFSFDALLFLWWGPVGGFSLSRNCLVFCFFVVSIIHLFLLCLCSSPSFWSSFSYSFYARNVFYDGSSSSSSFSFTLLLFFIAFVVSCCCSLGSQIWNVFVSALRRAPRPVCMKCILSSSHPCAFCSRNYARLGYLALVPGSCRVPE